ncbi:hypothetical protein IFM89_005532 [Coptis chinensis]|uniref:Oxidoreductase N-terminal domain-containing protein n=1 Tax=Coptis chinensis TaxID=261450 RepID=A0A835IA32_9MAGN|nr:hypothetical protein IFM89_005532 [Coptis chinensis]
MENKQIVLKDYVVGYPRETDMELRRSSLEPKVMEGGGVVLLKNLYLSCDPYMRIRMSKPRPDNQSYPTSFVPGSPINGYGASKVVESGHKDYKEGDLVWGITGWEQFTLLPNPNPALLTKIKYTDVPLSYYTGILAQLVGQFAKLMGCYVVGSAGTSEKDLTATLKRIAVCGFISQYNLTEHEDVRNLFCIVTKRIRMQGFIEPDYKHMYPEFLELVVQYIRERKIVYIEDIAEGLEEARLPLDWTLFRTLINSWISEPIPPLLFSLLNHPKTLSKLSLPSKPLDMNRRCALEEKKSFSNMITGATNDDEEGKDRGSVIIRFYNMVD